MQPATLPFRPPRQRRPAVARAAIARALSLVVRGAQVALAILGAISWVAA
jgi:hypothetical protein